jgi:hypothetical protein
MEFSSVHSGGLTNSTVEMCFGECCTPTWPASLLAMGLVYVQGGAAAEYFAIRSGHAWMVGDDTI